MLFQTEDDLDRFCIFDDFRVTLGEVAGVFVKRPGRRSVSGLTVLLNGEALPVTARHIDESQDNLVWHVVKICDHETAILPLPPEMELIEDYNISQVKNYGAGQQIRAKVRSYNERNR